MKKLLLSSFICVIFYFAGSAQYSRYIVKLKDKATNPYSLSNPLQYLGQRALDRRTRYNIPVDSTDLPVTPRYIDSIRLAGAVTILNSSKWLNQVAIQTTDVAALNKINSFPFVISSMPIAQRLTQVPVNKKLDAVPTSDTPPTSRTGATDNLTDYYSYGLSNGQVKIHHADFLHNHGFRGEGMLMTILDAGFYHYLTLPTFDSIRSNNQVLGTWDFVNNEASVDEDNSHGMQCLSTIAANMPGSFVGTAPKTSFYLFRTEDVASEYPIEEQNWAAGMERADSLGTDITSTSLGYYDFDGTAFDYTYADMDGNTTISARAADIAAAKGILLVSAAGNEGTNGWHYLITPSDADSVLSVGAVDTTGIVANFSSYGPSSDGQVKPAVAAVGRAAVVANTNTGQPAFGSGTSFACPNMAGVVTCLWQAFPEVNNMGIISVLEASANKSGTPDDRIGYGIPDVKKAFVMLLKQLYKQQSGITDCKASLQFDIKTDNSMSIDVERKSNTDADYILLTTLHDNGDYGTHHFSYDDNLSNELLGNFQYRLKMTIATDTIFYLDSVLINFAQRCTPPTENSILISPNPVTALLNIKTARVDNTKINIVIQNAAGQKVYANNFQQQPGVLLTKINMQSMSAGIYFITVYADNKKIITEKILKR